jgi:hypothetical protein
MQTKDEEMNENNCSDKTTNDDKTSSQSVDSQMSGERKKEAVEEQLDRTN